MVLVGLGRWLMGCFGGGFWSSVFGLVCWSVFVSSVARLLAFASMCSWAVWVTSWWFWVVVYIRAVPEGMVEIADAILDNPETKKKPKPLQDWQQRSRQDLVLGSCLGKTRVEQPFQRPVRQKLRTSTPVMQEHRCQNAVANALHGLWEQGVSGLLLLLGRHRRRGARRTGTVSRKKDRLSLGRMTSQPRHQRWPPMAGMQAEEKI